MSVKACLTYDKHALTWISIMNEKVNVPGEIFIGNKDTLADGLASDGWLFVATPHFHFFATVIVSPRTPFCKWQLVPARLG